eukprot:1140680-Pelagomonas_calceolata.AAC.3
MAPLASSAAASPCHLPSLRLLASSRSSSRSSRQLSSVVLASWRRQPPSRPDGTRVSGPAPPPPGTFTRNPRWRGQPPPPPPQPNPSGTQQQQQQQQRKQQWRPQFELRGTARRLYQNEKLRALVEQDVEEQHKGRWGPDPNATEEGAQGGAEGPAWPVSQNLEPPSWLDMISGNAEARKVMEWVQEQREARRRQQERKIDDQVSLLAWAYLLVAAVIGAVGLAAQV